MGRYLEIQFVFFGFMSLRNLAVCILICCCCVKKPQRVRDISNIFFILLDFVVVLLMSVYGTKALYSQSGVECRDNGDPNTFKWWVISMCCLAYGWIYSFLLIIGMTSLPLFFVFHCFYRRQMAELANQIP
jgi:hypothetical protein